MLKAKPSGNRLDEDDAAIVKGMLIGEVSTGAKFPDVMPAAQEGLPPPGPYLSGRQSAELLAKLGYHCPTE